MKWWTRVILFTGLLYCSQSQAQSLDIGLDLNINVNLANNLNRNSRSLTYPEYRFEEDFFPEGVYMPIYDYASLSFNDTVYTRFAEKSISNNVEVPLYARYTTKKNLFFDFSVSFLSRYDLKYHGSTHRTKDAYNSNFGDFEDFLASNGGGFDNWPVAGSPGETYNDSTAFLTWYDEQISNDPYRNVKTTYSEAFQFSSFYLGIGYKFAKHRDIHPYLYGGVGIRFPVASYSHEYFEIEETAGLALAIAPPNEIYIEKPSFTYRGGLGIEFYRYHAGVSYQFTQSPESRNSFLDAAHGEPFENIRGSLGFSSISFFLGADIFSFYFNTKNRQKETYEVEFGSLSKAIDKRRRWGISAHFSVPIYQAAGDVSPLGFFSLRDELSLSNNKGNIRAQTLVTKEIDRFILSPKFELSVRYGITNKLAVDLYGSFGQSDTYTEVSFGDNYYFYDSIAEVVKVDTLTTKQSSSILQTRYYPVGLGLNLCYDFIANSMINVRAVAGARMNFIVVPYTTTENRSPGINGDGDDDIFETVLKTYWLSSGSALSETNSFFVSNAENFDISQPQKILQMSENKELFQPLGPSVPSRSEFYFSARAGLELEFNRVLVGMSFDFTIGTVDNLFLKNYQNFNISIGYMLFENYRTNRKIVRTAF